MKQIDNPCFGNRTYILPIFQSRALTGSHTLIRSAGLTSFIAYKIADHLVTEWIL